MSKDIDKAIKTIQSAKDQGLIDDKQASELTNQAIRGMIGGGATKSEAGTTTEEVKELTETAGANNAAVTVSRPTGETVGVDARSSESNRSFIIEATGRQPEDRAFSPATSDKSGVTRLSVRVPRLPAGGAVRWIVPADQRGRIDLAGTSARTGENVDVHGIRAGLSAVDVEAVDAGGTPVESIKFRLSVPQFVTVDEEKLAFEQALTDMHVGHLKSEILAEARRTSEHLLRSANVRLIWQVPPMAEVLPAHVPPGQVVALTLRGGRRRMRAWRAVPIRRLASDLACRTRRSTFIRVPTTTPFPVVIRLGWIRRPTRSSSSWLHRTSATRRWKRSPPR